MCMCVCLRACLLERYTKKRKKKKTRHPTFEWDVVFAKKDAQKKKKKKQYFCRERDAA